MKESGWIITTHCNVTGMIVDILVKHIPQWLNQSQVGLGMFGDVTIQSWPSFCHLRRYPPGHPAIPFQGDELSLRISVDVRMESNVLKDFTVNLTRNLKLSRMVIFLPLVLLHLSPNLENWAVRQFAETKQAVWRLRGFLDGQWRVLDHLQESQRRSGLRQLGRYAMWCPSSWTLSHYGLW